MAISGGGHNTRGIIFGAISWSGDITGGSIVGEHCIQFLTLEVEGLECQTITNWYIDLSVSYVHKKNFRLIKLWYLNSTGNQFFFKSVEENGQPHTDWGRNKDRRRVFWTPITPTLYWWTMAHSTSLEWRSHFEPEWRTRLPTWKPTQAKVNKSIFINHQCRQFVLYTSATAYLTWLSQFKFYLKRNLIESHET